MKVSFNNIEEYEQFVKTESVEVLKSVLEAIKEAVSYNRKEAELFELFFKGSKYSYKLTLERAEWIPALDKCIEVFTNKKESDLAIDSYYLKEIVKEILPRKKKSKK